MNSKNYSDYISRQNEIVKLFSAISGTKEIYKIWKYLSKSLIFAEIGRGNSVYLYDSSSANLAEIVDELRESIGFRLGSEKITEKSISKYNVNKRLSEDTTTAVNATVTAKAPIALSIDKKPKKAMRLFTNPRDITAILVAKNRHSVVENNVSPNHIDTIYKGGHSKQKNALKIREGIGVRTKKRSQNY